MDGRLPPGSQSADGYTYWLGTDDQGRDMLSGILYGLRISLGVGAGSALIACVVGAALGLLAAYVGGRIDGAIMRLVDLQLSFPAILVALMILAFLGKGVDERRARAGDRGMGLLRPHRPRAPRWSSGGANTSRPPNAWRCRGGASCSAICCPTACRRS